MINQISKDNITECVEVIRKSFMTVANDFNFTMENAPRFTTFAISEERLIWHWEKEKRPMFAYTENHKIIGYYSLLIKDEKECELSNLCVLKEFRHQKIGEKLFEHACSQARLQGCIQLNIDIVEENVKLRKWYERHGAKHIGTKKFDFFPFTCGYMIKQL